MCYLRYTLFALCLLLVAPSPGLAQKEAEPTVVIVIRHAEKAADQGSDPGLTEKGLHRAQALLEAVGDAAVSAIYSSQFKRTQDTVAPLAEHHGVPITTMEVSGANLSTYPQELADNLLQNHRGETVVVVNHSNTVPLIVGALGGGAVPPITEEEYDDFFIVIIPTDGLARTIRAQYGLGLEE
ncbi:MAG TPA: phosphoglycerate mutase family protein [Rhodothermales bacterium]|nr:phosphoglycerate mutase family protein [Rhodothermales bacterium]